MSQTLTADSKERKNIPLTRGLRDYFPNALAEVAKLSQAANEKHNPGQDMHWSFDKSSDHADCIDRHQIDRGTIDAEDGFYHDVKTAWRALAQLETLLIANGAKPGRGVRFSSGAAVEPFDTPNTVKLTRNDEPAAPEPVIFVRGHGTDVPLSAVRGSAPTCPDCRMALEEYESGKGK